MKYSLSSLYSLSLTLSSPCHLQIVYIKVDLPAVRFGKSPRYFGEPRVKGCVVIHRVDCRDNYQSTTTFDVWIEVQPVLLRHTFIPAKPLMYVLDTHCAVLSFCCILHFTKQ